MVCVVKDRKGIERVQLSLAGVVTATAASSGILFKLLTHVAICSAFREVQMEKLAAAREVSIS